MAARRSVIVSLAGLLVMLLLVPAVAAAGGQAAGDRWSGGPPAAVAGSANGGDGRIAAAPQDRIAAALAGGRGYRVGSDFLATATGSGALTRGPGPEVTRMPARPDAGHPQATRVRGGPGGATRGGEPESAGSRGEHHRGSPAADPVPYAVPTRSAHEQNGPEPGTQGASAGRGRKDATHLPVQVTDETSAPDPVLLLRFLLVLGFRRVRPGNVLEHPLRRALHAAIVADPGLDLAGCAAATGANRETLRYHLALLVCCGKVAEETRSGSVRYFSHDPALTPIRRALLHALRNESLAPTLAGIRDAPGISRQVLADRLGVTGPSVTRQVQRLIEDGLVQAERCGRSQCYRLTEACGSALEPALAKGIAGGQVSDRAST